MKRDPPEPPAGAIDSLYKVVGDLHAIKERQNCRRDVANLRQFGACNAEDKSVVAAENAKQAARTLRPTSSLPAPPV